MVRDLLFFFAGAFSMLLIIAIGINSLIKDVNKNYFKK
jgi:hypothetical protein